LDNYKLNEYSIKLCQQFDVDRKELFSFVTFPDLVSKVRKHPIFYKINPSSLVCFRNKKSFFRSFLCDILAFFAPYLLLGNA
jgi:hypothetical protein